VVNQRRHFCSGVLGLLGTGLIGAAIYVRSVSNAALYWPLILLGSGGLLGIALVKNPFEKFREARRLDREGVTVTTPLLACFEGAADGDMTFYVAYTLPGVGPICHPVTDRIFKRVKAGDPITVVYHPKAPDYSAPVGVDTPCQILSSNHSNTSRVNQLSINFLLRMAAGGTPFLNGG
jgi:hypothetical protein